ncbi:hypothetical protein HLB44_27375 [Aquincola sp. S2]|uniref:DUF5330 domain-containing protein n=1 Tax=Pseudaquabacterium terrae TaxID=2732868 RepID=A0ABX2EQ37_9BURK|nr:hypothetical protein [Aquabacterium terrae]NRF70733.1 hypothetical protein [Aquabacterium terrae]
MRLAKTSLIAVCVAVLLVSSPAAAKLPPLSDEAKAKAAETAAKTEWTNKVGAYQLCRSMERTVEHYKKTASAGGKPVMAPVDTPPCTDPGAFVPPAATPPLEAAGAHSPPKTATAPPSSKQTAAELQGTAKK